MSFSDAYKWWTEPETQRITTDLMNQYPLVSIMTTGFRDNEIVVKVVTYNGKNIDGFPSEICGKRVQIGGIEILDK